MEVDTKSYATLCNLLGRGFLHHDPAWSAAPPPDRAVERLLDTCAPRILPVWNHPYTTKHTPNRQYTPQTPETHPK